MEKHRDKITIWILRIVVVAIFTFLIFFAIGIFVIQDKGKPSNHQFSDGDIIFQTSKSGQSKAIQIATNSKYSHMGILYDKDGKWLVFEAVQPVKLTPLDTWIRRGKGGHYVVKRLKNADQLLTPSKLALLKQIGKSYMGKNYDLYFDWSDDRMYCSELVWKIYHRALKIDIGKLQHLKDFDLSSPVVKTKLKERYGNKIPYDELVISPQAMFNSDLLVQVAEE